ncbi:MULTISPECIES: TRAP transporter small permease [unclassified Halomonas]|uniref:TRAP transporter small permease n=1 Tax=unclassified Halomonas TaxID=2609666 RepID=UPI001C96C02A|nr:MULTISPECIES: TRAP transporter small permease [unclassified Halomonas]MBY5926414.1 TRAP transporter small permease [Halomonas sp. DP4Y7-2]MBY6233456.1 TRAP transporter small permease [Halomonas sp. DP4Y7-1]
MADHPHPPAPGADTTEPADHHARPADTTPRRAPEYIIGSLALVAFIALAALQVVTRYVFNSPLDWSEELAAHLLVWLVFIGAIGVQREDSHLRVEMLDEWLSPRLTNLLRLGFDVLALLTLLALTWGGYLLYQSLVFDKLPALRWRLRDVMVIVPIASLLMAVFTLGHIRRRLHLLARHGQPEPSEGSHHD